MTTGLSLAFLMKRIIFSFLVLFRGCVKPVYFSWTQDVGTDTRIAEGLDEAQTGHSICYQQSWGVDFYCYFLFFLLLSIKTRFPFTATRNIGDYLCQSCRSVFIWKISDCAFTRSGQQTQAQADTSSPGGASVSRRPFRVHTHPALKHWEPGYSVVASESTRDFLSNLMEQV